MIALGSCKSNPTATSQVAISNSKDAISIGSYAFKTTDGWGYCITLDNKIYIKQTIIPVIQGNKSFATEEDAEKVALLVVNKIKTHQKPTIFKEELQNLQITE